jgi:hypothetical protein
MVADRVKQLADQMVEAAERTPSERERHVDFVRAAAIGLVVVGHWLAVAVTETDGVIDGVNALEELGWAHPLTWLFQVMPLFFFIGGYANAASLTANRRDGGDGPAWVLSRFERIVVPTTALMVALVIGVAVARVIGVGVDTAGSAAWLASIPMWFLAAYLAVLALAPLTEAADRRFGLWVPVALGALVVVSDTVRLGAGWELVGELNFVLVWLAVHQLGYSWRSGRLEARPGLGAPLAVAGLVTALALTALGPYPASMVGVPGDDLQNTAPPTTALLALGIAQIGAVLAIRDRAQGWLHRRRVWLVVVAVNAVMLTVFLWHMLAALVAAIVVYPTGLLPTVAIDSWQWLAWRPVWLLVCAAILAVFVALFGGIEVGMPGAKRGTCIPSPPAQGALWVGVVLVLVGMLGIAVAGEGAHGPLGLPTFALVTYFAGGASLLLARQGRRGE